MFYIPMAPVAGDFLVCHMVFMNEFEVIIPFKPLPDLVALETFFLGNNIIGTGRDVNMTGETRELVGVNIMLEVNTLVINSFEGCTVTGRTSRYRSITWDIPEVTGKTGGTCNHQVPHVLFLSHPGMASGAAWVCNCPMLFHPDYQHGMTACAGENHTPGIF